MESIKSDYSMYALNQTIYEKKEIHSIVTDGTIIDIKRQYQCEENNEESGGPSYKNNNSDENPKSLDGLDDELGNFFKNSGEQSTNSFNKRLKSEVDNEGDDNTDSEEFESKSESEDSGSEYIPRARIVITPIKAGTFYRVLYRNE